MCQLNTLLFSSGNVITTQYKAWDITMISKKINTLVMQLMHTNTTSCRLCGSYYLLVDADYLVLTPY